VKAMRLVTCALACFVAAAPSFAQPRSVSVGSKPFGESYILAEMCAQLLEARGFAATRRFGLGATEVIFPALRDGQIDVFPEYTGTGLLVILKDQPDPDPAAVFDRVAREFERRFDVRWLPPLGFENTYAMSVRADVADRLKLETLSDAARHGGQLRGGFSADFIGLPDGLPGLRAVYGLRLAETNALAVSLKYQAVMSGAVDIIDAYSTDGLLDRYPLRVLRDDRHFFPPYDAALLVRGALARDLPGAVVALSELSGRIDVTRMRRWNAQVEVQGLAIPDVARGALGELGLVTPGAAHAPAASSASQPFARYLWDRRHEIGRLSLRHAWLAGVALLAACLVAIPLGLGLARRRAGEPIVAALGVLQTVPGIALLAFMLPWLGIGVMPSIAALFLYSLYPIARNTVTGLREADHAAVLSARALGMTEGQVLRHVQLPLAAPIIMAGVRTAAVLAIGTATLAAFVGGGGLGDPIVAGLALADARMVLSGAIPAALMALAVDGVLAAVERRATPVAMRARGRRND